MKVVLTLVLLAATTNVSAVECEAYVRNELCPMFNVTPIASRNGKGQILPDHRQFKQGQVQPTAQQIAQLKKKGTMVRSALIAAIREMSLPKADTDSLVRRLQSVDILVDDPQRPLPSGVQGPPCKGDAMQAKFVPEINAVVMCSSYATALDSVALPTLAHELGHAVDPCTGKLWKVKTANLKSARKSFPGAAFLNHLKKNKSTAETLFHLSAQTQLESQGHIEEVDRPYDNNRYPLVPVGRCLTNQFNIELGTNLGEFGEAFKSNQGDITGQPVELDPMNPTAESKAFYNTMKTKVAGKAEIGCTSPLAEVLPDYLSSLATEKLMSHGALKLNSKPDQAGVIYAGLQGLCASKPSGAHGTHGNPWNRAKIFLSIAKIREAFGCELSQPVNCSTKRVDGQGGVIR